MTQPRSPEQVGEIIQKRVDLLDLSWAEIERRGGPSGRTVRAYCGGMEVKDIDKRRTLSRALDWTANSIRVIQEGGEPVDEPWTAPEGNDVTALADRAVSIINELARRAKR